MRQAGQKKTGDNIHASSSSPCLLLLFLIAWKRSFSYHIYTDSVWIINTVLHIYVLGCPCSGLLCLIFCIASTINQANQASKLLSQHLISRIQYLVFMRQASIMWFCAWMLRLINFDCPHAYIHTIFTFDHTHFRQTSARSLERYLSLLSAQAQIIALPISSPLFELGVRMGMRSWIK